MASVTLRGNPIPLSGELPIVGSPAPSVRLTGLDLADKGLDAFTGWRVLNIFPSVDTAVCALSVRTFNAKAAEHPSVSVLNISADLPFALKRFCGAEGIERAHTLSTFRGDFAEAFGLKLMAGPLAGLCARAVIVLDPEGNVAYQGLVPEIAQEPDYSAALAVLPA
jgi:thiol peroxidase